jgi:hypothetical protein
MLEVFCGYIWVWFWVMQLNMMMWYRVKKILFLGKNPSYLYMC